LADIGQIYFLTKKLQDENMKHPYVIIKKCRQKDGDISLRFLACMITSNAKKATWPYTIALNSEEGGMKKKSYVLCFQTIEINDNELGKYVGEISASRIEDVIMVTQNCENNNSKAYNQD